MNFIRKFRDVHPSPYLKATESYHRNAHFENHLFRRYCYFINQEILPYKYDKTQTPTPTSLSYKSPWFIGFNVYLGDPDPFETVISWHENAMITSHSAIFQSYEHVFYGRNINKSPTDLFLVNRTWTNYINNCTKSLTILELVDKNVAVEYMTNVNKALWSPLSNEDYELSELNKVYPKICPDAPAMPASFKEFGLIG